MQSPCCLARRESRVASWSHCHKRRPETAPSYDGPSMKSLRANQTTIKNTRSINADLSGWPPQCDRPKMIRRISALVKKLRIRGLGFRVVWPWV